jgi:hypothetical protein
VEGRDTVTEGQLRRATGSLTYEQWILRVMIMQPERICDPQAKRDWYQQRSQPKSAPLAVQSGKTQGVLAARASA